MWGWITCNWKLTKVILLRCFLPRALFQPQSPEKQQPKCLQPGTPEQRQGRGGSKRVDGNGKLKKKRCYQYASFCSATMLTSNTVTEIIENNIEFSECANSCSKYVSSRSWYTVKLPDTVTKRNLRPRCLSCPHSLASLSTAYRKDALG